MNFRRQTGRLLALAAGLCLSVAAQAPADVRIALVIGNAAYPAPATLSNPANDAAAMSTALRTLGFDVVELRDGSRAQMDEAVVRVRERLQGRQGIGMLYYAGHGLQLDFRNYMVPVDGSLASAADVLRQTLDVGQVIEAFRGAGTRMNILVLDACRDNPFGTGGAKGLAPLDAPSGTFLAYSTAPGNVAEDGDSTQGNGLYTSFLVKELQKPATRIEDVFKRVRLQVRQRSQGRQVPWESTSLEEDFYFNDGVRFTYRPEDLQRIAREAHARQEALERQARQESERDRQQAAVRAAEESRAAEAARLQELERAMEQARELERRKRLSADQSRQEAFQAEKAAWEQIRDSRNPEDFYAFLKTYPSGFTAELAQFRLDQLVAVSVTPQAASNAAPALAPGATRYRKGDVLVYSQRDARGLRMPDRSLTVTDVRAGQVHMNGSQEVWDEMGNLITDFSGTRSPGKLYFPADLALGKQWRSAYAIRTPRGQLVTLFWDFRVRALDRVTVPAGAFQAYRVEGVSRTSLGESQTETYWIDPATFLMVRDDWERRTTAGLTAESYRRELVRVTRAE